MLTYCRIHINNKQSTRSSQDIPDMSGENKKNVWRRATVKGFLTYELKKRLATKPLIAHIEISKEIIKANPLNFQINSGASLVNYRIINGLRKLH